MKRLFSIIFAAICVAMLCMTLVACSDAGAPEHDTSDPRFDISVEALEATLEDFLSDGRNDRTSCTVAEEEAARYLVEELVSYGYSVEDVKTVDFTLVANDSTELSSRHVTATYRTSSDNADNVIIGAYYDNEYGKVNSSRDDRSAASHSHGALSNGTGVATLLSIARYFKESAPSLDFDVTFAFFGASATSSAGVVKYIDSLGADGMAKVACMIELDRVGADHVYAFSDARSTKREALFDRVARENRLDIYKATQKSPQITGAVALDGIPYFQWVMGGLYPTFFNRGIPTLGIMGGNFETLDLTDTESAGHANVSLTSDDTLDKLKLIHPDYGEKMATAATLVVRSLTDEEFLSTVKYDRGNFPDTAVLSKGWVWELIVVGVVVVAAAVMAIVCSYLGKKYVPEAPKPPRNIKMAVFGMDYEDKTDDNIYIDIKDAGSDPFGDIFPGVPNNDGGAHGGTGAESSGPFDDYPDPPENK